MSRRNDKRDRDPHGRLLGTISSVGAESIVSGRDHTPKVNLLITVNGEEHAHAIDLPDALEIADHLRGAAEGAISDAFLLDFMHKEIGLELDHAVALIPVFRDYRTKVNSLKPREKVEDDHAN